MPNQKSYQYLENRGKYHLKNAKKIVNSIIHNRLKIINKHCKSEESKLITLILEHIDSIFRLMLGTTRGNLDGNMNILQMIDDICIGLIFQRIEF